LPGQRLILRRRAIGSRTCQTEARAAPPEMSIFRTLARRDEIDATRRYQAATLAADTFTLESKDNERARACPPATFADLGLSEVVLKGSPTWLRVPVADSGGNDTRAVCPARYPGPSADRYGLKPPLRVTHPFKARPCAEEPHARARSDARAAIQVAEAFQKYDSPARLSCHADLWRPELHPAAARPEERHACPSWHSGASDGPPRPRYLVLKGVRFVVLDEADEMLQMGLSTQLIRSWAGAQGAQVALFCATMAPQIKRIARGTCALRRKSPSRARRPRDRHPPALLVVSGMHKLDALTRILEVESSMPCLCSVRTKQSTLSLREET